jgi:hypothetical protein
MKDGWAVGGIRSQRDCRILVPHGRVELVKEDFEVIRKTFVCVGVVVAVGVIVVVVVILEDGVVAVPFGRTSITGRSSRGQLIGPTRVVTSESSQFVSYSCVL